MSFPPCTPCLRFQLPKGHICITNPLQPQLALTGWEMVTDREMLDRAQKQWREIVHN